MVTRVIKEIEGARNWAGGAAAGAIVVAHSVPLLAAFVPYYSERVQIGRFKVTRSRVDQLDQFTIVPPPRPVQYCTKCGKRMFKGTCGWCS